MYMFYLVPGASCRRFSPQLHQETLLRHVCFVRTQVDACHHGLRPMFPPQSPLRRRVSTLY